MKNDGEKLEIIHNRKVESLNILHGKNRKNFSREVKRIDKIL